MLGFLLILAYVICVPIANYLIGHVGTVCVPNGPCLIPVFPGVMAPSGVLVVGVALLFRDLVQRRYGKLVSIICILVGTVLSFAIAPRSLAIASASAFLFSELLDFAVYTPLARRHFALAIFASCVAGAAADSALFLFLAFGSFEHMLGQFIGKIYASVAYIVIRGGWVSLMSEEEYRTYRRNQEVRDVSHALAREAMRRAMDDDDDVRMKKA